MSDETQRYTGGCLCGALPPRSVRTITTVITAAMAKREQASAQLHDRNLGREVRFKVRPRPFEASEKQPIYHVAGAHPEYACALAGECGEQCKILVLRDNDRTFAHRPIPDRLIVGVPQPDVSRCYCVVTSIPKPGGERRW